VWIIKIGRTRLRTDITTFMPHKLGFGSGTFEDYHTKELRYCTDIIVMDLGHMPISDLSFLENMTNMQYLILAECTAKDFSVLRNLKELKYLELFLTDFDDATILADLPKLEDVNICYTNISDIRPLLTMTHLKNLWMSGLYRTSWRSREYVKETLTNTHVEFNTYGSTEGGWRQIPNYFAQRDLLGMGYMTG
jgi:Leucine-rich repeat (LRR) protein